MKTDIKSCVRLKQFRELSIKRSISTVLRALSIIMLGAVVLLVIFISAYSVPKFELQNSGVAYKGIFESQPSGNTDYRASFLGEWEFYPGLVFTEYPNDRAVFSNPDFLHIPISNINDAQKKGVYRLRLITTDIPENPVIYIPNLKDPVHIFINGKKQPPLEAPNGKALFRPIQNIFPVDALDLNLAYQEIIITAENGKHSSALYKRLPELTAFNTAISLSGLRITNAFIIFGLIIFVTLNGFIFMILRPQHRIISLITLFDTAIVLRLIFGSNDIIALFMTILPVYFTDSFLLSAKLFSFMLGGFVGSILANYLLDENNKVPRLLTLPIPIAYLILALFLPFNLNIFYSIGQPIFLSLFLYTFAIIFLQFIVYWKKNKTLYAAFQITKTSYIGVILFIDILLLSKCTNFLLYEYLYLFFFLAHVFTKLYDNNNSYHEVYLLNKNLEKTVEERTLELSHKNRVLSELSIRDPLTSIYNRLYFDETIEKKLELFNPQTDTLHLCMFDLDFFKSVNDRFGHDVGDEQLIFVVQTVKKLVLSGTIFARVGGEEFMLLYVNADSNTVLENLEKIRATFELSAKDNPLRTTASFGVVKYFSQCTKKEFLKLADRNLYEAKEGGRNKVVYDLSGTGD